MTPLAPELMAGLDRFARSDRVLVATDFDGVLAPLVLDPSQSKPLPGTIETLQRMASLPGVTVAIASGRDLDTLRQLTGLTGDDIVLIGSHGAEASISLTGGGLAPSGALTPQEEHTLRAAHTELDRIVQDMPLVRIESKPAGVVLHTRGMPEPAALEATARAMDLPRNVPGLHAMRGKSVVELTVLDVSKGAALTALAQQVQAPHLAYFGDDVTDETVFALLHSQEGHFCVKVGEGETAARYRLESCEEMPDVLLAIETALSAR